MRSAGIRVSSGIKEALIQSRAVRCLSCGKCSAVCPVTVRGSGFSPRVLVEWVMAQPDALDERVDAAIWTCLTCGRCSQRCNSDVDYPSFVRRLRAGAERSSKRYLCSRGAALQGLSRLVSGRLQRIPGTRADVRWLDGSLKVASESSIVLFVGCLPHFQPLVRDVGARPLDIARSAVKILNSLGIEPGILRSEACCGHDFLWTGDVASFLRLAEHNVSQIVESKADLILTPCPECYRTLKVDYPAHLGSIGAEVVHLSQFLAERMVDLPTRSSSKKIVTYHDACRLGRFSGIFDQPRQVLTSIPGVELREMGKSREMAECCGSHAWSNCGPIAKEIQIDTLRGAGSTGASTLVTACPKCEIHFKCAMRNSETMEGPRVGVMDLFTLVADAMA